MKPVPASDRALTEAQGKTLVAIARQTLVAHFQAPGSQPSAADALAGADDPAFERHCGTFVTLTKRGQLRGCIGSLVGQEPLKQGVRTNAINAAFHDPRFDPLRADELAHISLEVSVLTDPKPLEYSDGEELRSVLRPEIDGVTIRHGYRSATFLPQVWQQLTTPETFLSHLCMKAGLAADEWKKGDLEVETYQVQHFDEGP